MKTIFSSLFLLIFPLTILHSQNVKYKISYVAYFLPGSKKISGKVRLGKKDSKLVENILNKNKISITFSREGFNNFKKIADSLRKENKFIEKCEKIYNDIEFNKILNLEYQPKNEIENNEVENNFAEMIVVEGIPFKFSLTDNYNKNTLIFKDNFYNRPYFKNLKEFYVFYYIINNLKSKGLTKFKNYFSTNNLYGLIIKLLAYNNCT